MSILLDKEKLKEIEKIDDAIKKLKQELYIAESKYVLTWLTHQIWNVNGNNIDDVLKNLMKFRNTIREFNPDDLENELNKIKGFIDEIVKHGEVKLTQTIYPGIRSYEGYYRSGGRRGRRSSEVEEACGGCL